MILQIETATTSCSVALSHNGIVMSKKELDQRNVHAEVLTLFIQDVCAEAGIALADLDAVAVSSGPGSYTGLRIGVSTAKGLCFALDKPLIAVESLKAMADGMAIRLGAELTDNTLLCPMIDARRMEVFAAMFDTKGNKVMPTEAVIVDGDSFADLLADHQIIFFGDGAMKCRETVTHPNASFVDGFANSAIDITTEATVKLAAKEFQDVAYFEPYYLKDFIAGVKKSV
ncbi:tRNA (adenosine(37)-N6)-threonylcarbamoyltransferase complex dimerization subunit type 1 TsaB [Mucilaginibacter myungsuensis]|uniref:tRNA (Adenosine(37)-N6)-threonylcarbamoyltransferase complex dimerization subunit type 1 TsaB n=1 Tax=Mucilaginibacter myungsuensis TaxID=649104 RepID=A0A929PWJ9_9SPHI|nr:tRNA (adenosine(37)-N6)-threonylcarbamoyltransferase complex dimerization subunit type 1 TsaB [Mucilaginibacter myungsuensis]MBE9662166.1 tRNA (adenosine(37)-N6)-threonylcarbamoyltransferase complex dimerization subunit type 1 TsaB [Mucilaginibacter myungsuensis]MDN3599400.1 tRNA (adenosine(37)-N6)-threonylcarbamoyltransferase complex dimerization subunit type 1 TsaB [Mucilaginibacter myungsuensis]